MEMKRKIHNYFHFSKKIDENCAKIEQNKETSQKQFALQIMQNYATKSGFEKDNQS